MIIKVAPISTIEINSLTATNQTVSRISSFTCTTKRSWCVGTHCIDITRTSQAFVNVYENKEQKITNICH